ncbi:hypothetical protein [Lewinella sp. LCG006]
MENQILGEPIQEKSNAQSKNLKRPEKGLKLMVISKDFPEKAMLN